MSHTSAEPTPVRSAPPRTSRLSLTLIFLSLLALGALPLFGDYYVNRYRDDVRELVEPARNLTTEIHVSLALGSAALRNFLNTNDPVFLTSYGEATARERAAYSGLEPIAARLDTAVFRRYRELLAAQTRWHSRVDQLLQQKRDIASIRRVLADEESYENTLIAAARLDDALARVTLQQRRRVDQAERLIRLLSLALASVAAVAGLIALSLGRKLEHFAVATEQARRELEEVLGSRARLARSVTHDLKNPLNAIMGNLQLLEMQGGLTPNHQERIHKVEKSASSMLGMIDSLLELERAKSGQLQLERTRVDVRALVAEVAENHRGEIESAGLELRIDLSERLEPIESDPARVTRVLDNLLSNACKYTEEGFVAVRTVPAQSAPIGSGPWIAIEVQDSGRGIPAQDLERIFEEFSRLETPGVSGAGLGLAVSRRLARLLGGDITVISQAGKGSRFTLWLPRTARPLPDLQRSSTGGSGEQSSNRATGRSDARAGTSA